MAELENALDKGLELLVLEHFDLRTVQQSREARHGSLDERLNLARKFLAMAERRKDKLLIDMLSRAIKNSELKPTRPVSKFQETLRTVQVIRLRTPDDFAQYGIRPHRAYFGD